MRKKIILLNILSVLIVLTVASTAKANVIGLDVSHWQGVINWDQAAPYAGFAIIKAGGGDDGLYVDPQFERNRAEVRRLGIPHGYYFYAGDVDPLVEADYFSSIVGPLQPGEVVALDFEIPNNDPVLYSWMFLTRVEQHLGVKPMLYTNFSRVWEYDWALVAVNGNMLWGAKYDEDPSNIPIPRAWPYISIKQFTSSGQIPGIATNVDVNSLSPGVSFESLGMPAAPPKAPGSDTTKTQTTPQNPAEVPADVTQAAASGESLDSSSGQTQTQLDSSATAEAQQDTQSQGAGSDNYKPASTEETVIHNIVMGPIVGPLTKPVTEPEDVKPSLLDPLVPLRNLEVAVNQLVAAPLEFLKK